VIATLPDEVIRPWPDGPPSKLEGVGPEIAFRAPVGTAGEAAMLRNVSVPTLTVFRPAKPNGIGVIVCPGGGWRILAWEHEGAFLVVDVAMDPHAAPLAFVAAIYGGETLGRPVPSDVPPLFACIAQDDVLLYRVVEGLYSDWTDAGRPAELHIYRRGAHGFGMVKQGLPSDRWIEQFHDWLTDLGFA
jgi:hypothetical protein